MLSFKFDSDILSLWVLSMRIGCTLPFLRGQATTDTCLWESRSPCGVAARGRRHSKWDRAASAHLGRRPASACRRPSAGPTDRAALCEDRRAREAGTAARAAAVQLAPQLCQACGRSARDLADPGRTGHASPLTPSPLTSHPLTPPHSSSALALMPLARSPRLGGNREQGLRGRGGGARHTSPRHT